MSARSSPRESDATGAACRVAAALGYPSSDPALLQETNNTVVWLRPHDIIAKVGKWSHSEPSLTREHKIAASLAADGAPVARPLPGSDPMHDAPTGYIVTLWERLVRSRRRVVDPTEIGSSLRELHQALSRFDGELPSFEVSLDLAQTVLWDDGAMKALASADRALLRETFARLRDEISRYPYREQPLHGEAHDGNLLITPDGLRWIDFEGASMGPLEWDLAFLPDAALGVFPEADEELLGLLRTLNSARVATWCFVRWDFHELRSHAEHHLEKVRRALGR
jgi:aminoglycoside phosphotransferase (APT) family kinase protein